jgi:uncharacterized protein (TIGR02594 family)
MKWVNVARSLIGTKEVPGAANNPKIMGWGNALSVRVLGIPYTKDSIPWCGLFAAWCVTSAGFVPPKIAIRASEWGKFGTALPLIGTPPLGAIAVFSRTGGGHVGFVVGVHANGDLDILGGNQGDEVNVRRFARDRLTHLRWPPNTPVGKAAPTVKGTKATTGEA